MKTVQHPQGGRGTRFWDPLTVAILIKGDLATFQAPDEL
jgi:inosine-uridine nucleoside N-ribohydrolase